MKSRRGWIQKNVCMESNSKIPTSEIRHLLRDDAGFRSADRLDFSQKFRIIVFSLFLTTSIPYD